MGRILPDTLPVENQSAVLHQKLLSYVGLGLGVVAPQPRHLSLKPNLFFSDFFPLFGPFFRWRFEETLWSWVCQNYLPRITLPLYEYFCIGPYSRKDSFNSCCWTTAAKTFAISFFVITFSRTQLILSPNVQTREDMEMVVVALESPPSPLSDNMSTLFYFCPKT